jgi:hypothetical protein
VASGSAGTASAPPSLNGLQRLVVSPLQSSILASLFVFASCYLLDFSFPNTPFALWGDQVGFYNGGSRMVLGQLPFRDYFEVVPPGTDLVYALLIRIFGLRLWIPNLVMAGLAGIAALLMTLIAARILRGAIVFLPALLLAGFVLLCSIDATHHWFSTVLILAALLVLIDGTSWKRVAAAGALCGLAASFTQSKGAMATAGFVIYLAFVSAKGAEGRYRWRRCLLLIGATLVAFAAVNGYFIQAAGFRLWLWSLIVYPLRYYPTPSINNWRVIFFDLPTHLGGATWISYPFVYATVPWVCIIVLVLALWRGNHDGDEMRGKLLLLAITAFATFLAAASSPSLKRLAILSPPSLILLAWLVQRPGKWAAALRILLGGAALALAIVEPLHLQRRAAVRLDLPSGRAAFVYPAMAAEYEWMLEHTHPGEYMFGMSPFYFALHLLNPAAIEGFDPSSYSRPEQITALVHALDAHQVPILVLWRTQTYFWPRGSASDPLDPFRAYVRRDFALVRAFPSGDEVWMRKPSAISASAASGSL